MALREDRRDDHSRIIPEPRTLDREPLRRGQGDLLVEEAAQCPLFLFVKEDEDLYPDLDYSPVRERARRAMAAIDMAA